MNITDELEQATLLLNTEQFYTVEEFESLADALDRISVAEQQQELAA